MKTLMITAPSSGSGKTTVTMGIIRALKNMGYIARCFKTGPDYIDRAFLEAASGNEGGNLDMHLQGREGMKMAFSMGKGDLCIIEGAMGYFDGIGNGYKNSSYDISNTLEVNSLLIYTPKGEMFTAIPKIKGMVEFEGSRIKGVVINRVTKHYYQMLKGQIEKYCNVPVLGFLPPMEDVELKSRHLGLVQSLEIEDIEYKIERVGRSVLENVDMNSLIALMTDITPVMPMEYRKREITVAIALDKAFSFYYRENLRLFEESCNVVYFSPINDKKIPGCDFLYLGGGYPEVFRDELSSNTSMIQSIREYGEDGGHIYGECGGFMYLTEAIEGSSMVGIFKGKSHMTDSLQRFGYIDISLKEDCMLGRKGDRLTAHEFHKSISEVCGKTDYSIAKTGGSKAWECGYRHKNVLGGYPHINFIGNLNAFNVLLDNVERGMKK